MKVVEFTSLEDAEKFADRCDAEFGAPPVEFIGGGRHSDIMPRNATLAKHPTDRRWIAVVREEHAEKLGAVELRPDFFPESPSAKAKRITPEEAATAATTEPDAFTKQLLLDKSKEVSEWLRNQK